jgi:glycosyltransferase involved in cell wall biosynthesis
VHNYYGSEAPSGENSAVDAEIAMLGRFGHDVVRYHRHSDEVRGRGWRGTMQAAASVSWNPWTVGAVRRIVRRTHPDVVHVHNYFPLISPSVFAAAHRDVPCVYTLHNYRPFCASALLLRDGRFCRVCIDKRSALPGVVFGCYRGSRLASVPVAAMIGLHRQLRTWQRQVDAFVALTDYHRSNLLAAGLDPTRVHVKPNFAAEPRELIPWSDRAAVVTYVGRLTEEKGVEYLIRAWLAWGASAPVLRIIGDGELFASLKELAASKPNIQFAGRLSRGDTLAAIGCSKLLVLPSIAPEGFPLVIHEAFASGTPVAVSDAGPLPAIVAAATAGVVFAAADSKALETTLRRAWNDEVLERYGRAARHAHEQRYNEARNHDELMTIYAAAIARHRPAP